MIEAGFLLALGIIAGLAILAVLAVALSLAGTVAAAGVVVFGMTLGVIAQRLWPVLVLATLAAVVYWWAVVGQLVMIAGIFVAPVAFAYSVDFVVRRVRAALKARQGARIAP